MLVIGESFRLTSGGGITLANLFRNWPSHSLANIHDIRERNFHSCANHYVAANSSYRSLIFKQSLKVSGIVENNAMSTPISIPINVDYNVLAISRLIRIFERRIIPHWLLQDTILDRELRSWIDQFNPQLLYFQPSASSLRLGLNIIKHLSCPIVLHFMDDWIEYESMRPRLIRLYIQKWLHKRISEITSKAKINMAISERMAIIYKKKYNVNFLSFQNPVKVENWALKRPEVIALSCEKHCKLLFPGKINHHNVRTLNQIAQTINNAIDMKNSISLFITDNPSDLSQRYDLDKFLIGRRNYSGMPALLASHDILLLPFGFEKKSISYAGLSMPTKVPEFLASGIPILVIAPASTALSDYAISNSWALVVNSMNPVAISNAINQLKNSEVRMRLSLNARFIANKNHNLSVVRDTFQSILINTAIM